MKPAREWMQGSRHLPPFFRDFHTQKDVFKWIWRRVEDSRRRDPSTTRELEGMNWIATMIFVIDFFLWFMALHGYTLQRARPDRSFASWEDSLRKMRDEDAAVLRGAMVKGGESR